VLKIAQKKEGVKRGFFDGRTVKRLAVNLQGLTKKTASQFFPCRGVNLDRFQKVKRFFFQPVAASWSAPFALGSTREVRPEPSRQS
jgi:hypothetical protein